MNHQPEKPAEAPAEHASVAEALEHFVYDNPDLERLEAILDDFNPFVAVQWSKQELRHSAFLRWLLDPTETHGLGSYFLAVFWKRVAKKGSNSGAHQPSVIDVDSWDMSAASVQTEWRHVDLLV